MLVILVTWLLLTSLFTILILSSDENDISHDQRKAQFFVISISHFCHQNIVLYSDECDTLMSQFLVQRHTLTVYYMIKLKMGIELFFNQCAHEANYFSCSIFYHFVVLFIMLDQRLLCRRNSMLLFFLKLKFLFQITCFIWKTSYLKQACGMVKKEPL